MSNKLHLRGLLSLIFTLVFLANSLHLLHIPFLDNIENHLYDWRLKTTAPKTVDERIIIADIDERSINALGHWPWRRDTFAQLMDSLFDHYHIKQLGFDVVFSETDNDSAIAILEQLAEQKFKDNPAFIASIEQLKPSLRYDQHFADSLSNRNTVLGYIFKHDNTPSINPMPKPLFAEQSPELKALALPHPISYTNNLELFQNHAMGNGFFDNNAADSDGIFRRATLIQEFQGYIFPSLSLAMLSQNNEFSQNISLEISESGGYKAIESIRVGYWNIPLNPEGDVFIPYRGPQKSFPYISISDIINKTVEPSLLNNKIVIVGASAPGVLDLRSTPFDKSYPGVEIHANIISGVLDGSIKMKPFYSEGLNFVVILISSLVMVLLLPKLNPIINLISTAVVLVTVTVINFAFWQQGLIIPLAPIFLLITALFVVQIYYGFIIKTLGERHLTKTFGQYIPPEVVKELSKQNTKLDLSGKNKEMTVLFTDIRGFTNISEGLAPQELTELMNSFLTPITFAIYQHKGTIDKYMGDAVMAFWGAPIDQPEHASKGIHSAFEMLKHLEELKPSFAAKGWPNIEIGIGLNSGPMNVGNMGSSYRVAYTVLGDAVNLGARLEGLTKVYGATIIVSESTKQLATGFSYLELDKVRVKGKKEPISIYEPLGLTEQLPASALETVTIMEQALDHYRQQNWQQALSLFQQLNSLDKAHKVYAIYIKRIHEYQNTPPPKDWDGVTNHTEK